MVDIGAALPHGAISLRQVVADCERLAARGYTSFWTGEVDGLDGFAPLLAGALAVPGARFGTSIVSPFTRGPALLAMEAAAVADVAPGRFALGLGAGSTATVAGWNSARLEKPYQRMRDTVRFLRRAFAGERVNETYETFSVRGFRLALPPDPSPLILLAALRPGMLRLAACEADGVILNWVSPDDVRTSLRAAPGQGEVACRIYVCPGVEREEIAHLARKLVAVYLDVEAYAEQQRWLGRGAQLAGMWAAWQRGDRRGAAAAVPDEVLDAFFVCGDATTCEAGIRAYVDAGVTTPILTVFPFDADVAAALTQLSPAAMH
jgi:probable F420-dependent oxidoreductase